MQIIEKPLKTKEKKLGSKNKKLFFILHLLAIVRRKIMTKYKQKKNLIYNRNKTKYKKLSLNHSITNRMELKSKWVKADVRKKKKFKTKRTLSSPTTHKFINVHN